MRVDPIMHMCWEQLDIRLDPRMDIRVGQLDMRIDPKMDMGGAIGWILI